MMRTLHGFTLVEAIVTLGVLAGLVAASAPSFADLLHDLRLEAVTGDVLRQLMLARSEAVKLNGRAVLCKSVDGEQCTTSGHWEQGWILFHDRNNSGTREQEEALLQRVPPLPAGWRLITNGPVADYVSYGPMGGATLVSGAFQAGTFTVCRASARAVDARKVIINAVGRPRVQKVRLESCA